MLILSLLFASSLEVSNEVSNSTTSVSLERRGILDPVKNFYNTKIVESAISALKPGVQDMLKKMTLELKEDHVKMAPEWLQQSLAAIFGLDPNNGMSVIKNLWQRAAVKIIGLFQDGIRKELDIVLSRFEVNMEANMYEVVRTKFYWRKLGKRGIRDWYRGQIEKIIQKILPLLNDAAHKTTIQTKDDYGNRVGDVARRAFNAFLPDDLQIPDLSKSPKYKLAGIGSYIKEKLIAFIKLLQSKIKEMTGKAFEKFEAILRVQIEVEVRRVVAKKVPFYGSN